jgi:CubicO group peptidase (beta-lactamase class C family)
MERMNLPEQIDSLFVEWDRRDTPGLVVGVLQHGQWVYQRCCGIADLDHDMPLTSRSLLDIGSTSKQFTAACIALLALDGVLDLDSDIRQYLPELPDYGCPIIIRQLIHHTAGLRDHTQLYALSGMHPENYTSHAGALELICRQRGLNFEPGTGFLYTNTGYVLLAEIVQRASGKSLRQFASERLFQPLGMSNTRFDDDCREAMPGRATGYRSAPGGGFRRYVRNTDEVGASNLWTCLEDLARWDHNFYQPAVGGAALLDLILSPGRLTGGQAVYYAFGLMLGKYRGRQTVSHAGSFNGFRSELLRFPETGLTIIMLTNLESILPTRLAYRAADLFLNEEMDALAAAPAHMLTLPADFLASTAGVYRSQVSGEVTHLSVIDHTILAEANGRTFRLGLVSESNGEFELRVLDVPLEIRLSFRPDNTGRWTISRSMPGLPPELFLPVEQAEDGSDDLACYTGQYRHPDLPSTWRMVLNGKRLEVIYGRYDGDVLQPTGRDTFAAPNIAFQFVRDQDGQVCGVGFETERVKNMVLDRLKDGYENPN